MTTDEVKALIERAIPGARAQISGEGCNLAATVVAEAFEGLPMLKQHQMVYASVQSHIASGEIHALAIKSYTPAQWEALQQRQG